MHGLTVHNYFKLCFNKPTLDHEDQHTLVQVQVLFIVVDKFAAKSRSRRPQTNAKEETTTGTGPNIQNKRGNVIQSTLSPTKANVNPLSNMVSVWLGFIENSPNAFTKKLASIKKPSAIELHKKLATKKIVADPYFSTIVFPVCDPKKALVKRLLTFKVLFVKAAIANVMRIVIVAVSIVSIKAFLKLWTANVPFFSLPYHTHEKKTLAYADSISRISRFKI